MIKTGAPKSPAETSKFKKCIIIWLIVLSVLLIAMLTALIAIGFKLYKTDCTCNNDAEKVAVGNNTCAASFVPPNEIVLIEFIKVYTDKAKDELKNQLTEDVKEQLVLLEEKIFSKIEHNNNKAKDEIKSQLTEDVKEQLVSLEKGIFSKIEPNNKLNSQWTSLSTSFTQIDTASPGVVSQIHLSAIGVPQDATEVFVFAVGATGVSYPNDAVGEIEVYSYVSMKQYVHMHSWGSGNDWSYNSDNLWVPIGENRIVYGKYVGPAITKNRYAKIRVIGYR